jgi:hypothetical protein
MAHLLSMGMPVNRVPTVDLTIGDGFRRVMLIPWRACNNPTVTIDDRSESGAWDRALRDTPQVDRNLGRGK